MKLIVSLLSLMLSSPLAAHANALPDLHLEVEYSVPLAAADVDLAEVNSFRLVAYRIDRAVEGAEKMSFELPHELTAGKAVPVELTVVSRQEDLRTLEGPRGRAECRGPWVSMVCHFVFRDLAVDADEAEAFVGTLPRPPEERVALGRLSRLFNGDPLGVGRVLGPALCPATSHSR